MIECVNVQSPTRSPKPSYATGLFEDPLSCAYGAAVHTPFDNPGDDGERANGLNEVAYEKGKKIYRGLSANEVGLVR